jgi:3-hydroxybutyryl-CoA dehydratase
MTAYKTRKYAGIRIGEKASISKTISAEDIDCFGRLTGDLNPVHMDPEFAAKSLFKERIAHGLLTGSLISAVFGTRLPGPNTIYLRQEMNFLAPVKIGDTIRAECEVTGKQDERKRLSFSTTVTNQDGVVVLDGKAEVMMVDDETGQ